MLVMDKSFRPAWQPLTPRGVAAFANAGLGRLLLVQSLVALVVALVVIWQLDTGWFPTIESAIGKLPARGEIRSQQLDWRGESPLMLAEGRFLALTVDLNHTHGLRSLAHVQVEFGRETFVVRSLFGYAEAWYPPGWVMAFNQTELKPWWGAWKPVLLAGAGVGAGLGVLLSWWLLATLYFLPVQLAGYFADRDLTPFRSWRLAGAALMPGAVLMVVALVLYGLGSMDLVQLLFAVGAHLVVGWIYLFLSLLFVPSAANASSRRNPFTQPPDKA